MANQSAEFADFCDPLATKLAEHLKIDLDRFGGNRMTRRSVILRSLWFEVQVHQQLAFAQADASSLVVVNLASGFDTAFSRFADQNAVGSSGHLWIDADLPNVNRLKRDFSAGQFGHRIVDLDLTQPNTIASVLEPLIAEATQNTTRLHVMFLTEGVLMYLSKETVKNLLASLCDFGSQYRQLSIVLDWCSPLLTRFSRWHPGLRRAGIVDVPFSWCVSQAEKISQLEPRLQVEHSDDPVYRRCNIPMAALAWSYGAWHRALRWQRHEIYGCSRLGLSSLSTRK